MVSIAGRVVAHLLLMMCNLRIAHLGPLVEYQSGVDLRCSRLRPRRINAEGRSGFRNP